MNEFLSSSRVITHNKYNRLMVIACLNTILNLPMDMITIITSILSGKDDSFNHPYISWENVHNGEGGNAPGLSLSSIVQTPASEWSTAAWGVFWVKWYEWFLRPPGAHVLRRLRDNSRNATIITDPRFGSYQSGLGTKDSVSLKWRRYRTSRSTRMQARTREIDLLPIGELDVACRHKWRLNDAIARRRGSLSFLETTVDTSASRSEAPGMVESNDLESEVTAAGIQVHHTARAVTFVDGDGDESQGAGGI